MEKLVGTLEVQSYIHTSLTLVQVFHMRRGRTLLNFKVRGQKVKVIPGLQFFHEKAWRHPKGPVLHSNFIKLDKVFNMMRGPTLLNFRIRGQKVKVIPRLQIFSWKPYRHPRGPVLHPNFIKLGTSFHMRRGLTLLNSRSEENYNR